MTSPRNIYRKKVALPPEVSLSSTQVSRAAERLDAGLAAWRERPLDETPYLFLDARYERVREAGRLVDCAVLVAVVGVHRGETFAACQFIIDTLKTRAPFWKREVTPAGGRWVDARAADDQAAERWQE